MERKPGQLELGSRLIVALSVAGLLSVSAAPGALGQTQAETSGNSASPGSAPEPTIEPEPTLPPVELADLEAIEKDRNAKKNRHPLGKRISRYMRRASEQIDEGNPEEAIALLERLDPKRLNINQRALIYRLLGFISYSNQQTDEAVEWFKKALAQEALPLRDESRLRFGIAQLHAGNEQWPETLAAIDEWRRFEAAPDPLGFYLRAISLYQLQDYDGAIASVREALALSSEPREGWLRLLSALYLSEKQDYDHAIPVLEELLLRFPKKQYWVQLSLLYGARENYDISLAVQQMAYSQGYLTEDKELRRLARSYLYRSLPYPAAKVLAEGLEKGQIDSDSAAYELLANSWIQAREYDESLPPLVKAAELAENGDLHVRLGQVHMQREQWSEAARMLERAGQKGDLKDPGNGVLLLGIAHYNDGQLAKARRSFVKASKYDALEEQATRWIKHIDRESSTEVASESQSGGSESGS